MQNEAALNWERRVGIELYRDYSDILQQRKIKLTPAAIALMDSDSHWGRFDSQSRTIFISRRLIEGFSWFHVLGVLKHEMAHQYVNEVSWINARPHGELFKDACMKLGVPHEFCGASAHLQMSKIDWREEKRDEVSERMLDKVRKLLSLATSSNEFEALLAMNKVRELYAKYNLEETSAGKASVFGHTIICHQKKRQESHYEVITGILVGHFFVKIISFKLFDAKTGEYHRAIEMIGRRDNVLMAEYVYSFLLQQLEYQIREFAKVRRISKFERKSYRLGILEGFREKLKSSTSESTTSVPNETHVVTRALAEFKKDAQLDAYLSAVHPRLGVRSVRPPWIDGDIYSDGKRVGRSLVLHKALIDRKSGVGFYLEKKS